MGKKYKSQKKRAGRKELIAENKKLKRDVQVAEDRVKDATWQCDMINKRIQQIGMRCVDMRMGGGPIETIDIQPEPFGMYVMLDDGRMPDPELSQVTEWAKGRLVHQIANALVEKNMVQFICRRHGDAVMYDPLNPGTIGAKLYVVPWEKMAMWRDTIRLGNIRRYENGW